jgi:hypothetical protein
MLRKISKMSPWCPKRLPGDKYTSESQLPGGEYIGESRLHGGEYTGESRLPCDEYLGSRLLSVLWTSIRTGLQKNFLMNNRPGSQDSPVYYTQGSLDSLEYFALEGSFVNQFRSTPRCIHYRGVSTPRWWIHQGVTTPWWWIHRESWLPSSKYTEESITKSNNSSNIRKNSKSFLGVSNWTRRRCLMNKTRVKKSRDTVPLISHCRGGGGPFHCGAGDTGAR